MRADQNEITKTIALARGVALIRGLDGAAADAFASLGVTCRVDEARVFGDSVTFAADGSPTGEGELEVVMTFPEGHEAHDAFGATFASEIDALGRLTARVTWVDFERFVERAAA